MHRELNFSWLIQGEIAGSADPGSSHGLLFLQRQDIKALVRMAEGAHASKLQSEAEGLGLRDYHEPMGYFTAPSQEQIERMVSFARACVAKGMAVGVSCRAGLGRTGTILACYLVAKGKSADEAVREVRLARPGSVETPEQVEAVREYAHRLQNTLPS